jgi:hypothetical protein
MEGGRSALIVANDRYQDPQLRRLRAPARDAEALARVLGDREIGDFQVKVVTNQPEHRLRREIAAFFADRGRDDLVLAHFSCHGVKDDSGQLYLATPDTELQNLDATAVPADFINRHMTRSRSRRAVLLLDCCYSGAFARGMLHRADRTIDLAERFEGRGRIVLTASSAMEYAFEDAALSRAEGQPSVFTRALVQGLQTGDADRDGDGHISVDELYDYVFDQVRTANPKQTPGRWDFDLQGDFLIAHSRHLRPVALPPELQQALEHPVAGVRLGTVEELADLLRGSHPGLALAAHQALERLRDDDSQRVSSAAAASLAAADGAVRPEPPRRDRDAPGRPAPQPASSRPPAGSRPRDPAGRLAGTSSARPVSGGSATTRPATPPPSGPRRPSAGTAPAAPRRPARAILRRPLVLFLSALLLAGGLLAVVGLRTGQGQEVQAGQRFQATAPWRLQVRGEECGVWLADGHGRPSGQGYGSDFVLQMRASGEFFLRSLSGHCHATVVPGAGRTSNLPVALPAGKGGDTPPFHSSDGFRVTVAGTSCRTEIYRAREGSEVTEFAGSDTSEYALRGDYFVRSETRCSTTVTPA